MKKIWRERILQIVRKTMRDGYLTEELDELVDSLAEEIAAANKNHVQSQKSADRVKIVE